MNSSASAGSALFGSPVSALSPVTVEYPFYHFARHDVIPGLSDKYLSIIAPFIVYWVLSFLFQLLDWAELPWIEKYRIHEPDEVKTRNRVTINQVVWMVLFQQTLQTALGLYWLEDDDERFGPFRDHRGEIGAYKQALVKAAGLLLPTNSLLAADKAGWINKAANVSYWWLVPLAQFIFAA
jgi:sphinganine C4-monooxygenase